MKPKALRPGDTIGIIAPSWCGPAIFPHRVEQGKQFLEGLGYKVVLAPHTGGRQGYLSGSPDERVADIHQMFADPNVHAILAAIGGDHSCHLLPLLDFDLIRQHPKIFLGYSDVTVLNLAIYARTGLVTFNGAMLMTDLAEFPKPLPYTITALLNTIRTVEPVGRITSAAVWTEEFLDWGQKLDLTRPRHLESSAGWTWLKSGRGQGPLVGGCLESMQHLRGTPYWPNMDGAILFFETSEVIPTPAWVDGVLQDYENMGVLGKIRGLLVGRSMGYTPEQREQLRAILLERTARYDFPIVTDMDFGHTAPQFTLPIGCQAVIDSSHQHFAITEAAVST